MPLDPDVLLNWPFEPIEHAYDFRDTILYALGVGLGADPMNEAQLPFVFEEPELLTLPTMAVVLAYPGFWIRDPKTGVDWVKILHGEQGLTVHNPLPSAATVVATTKVTSVLDKGADKGALIYSSRTITDTATGKDLATVTATGFARGDGGFGGPSGPSPPVHTIPDRAPDEVCDLPTLPQAALIYRLSGDYNPLHASPSVAKAAGFERPILHGLCTYGVAGHAILKTQCGYDPRKLKSMDLRFSAPVFPGETIRTEMWRDDGVVSFRATALEREIVVLNNGRAEVAG
jgi:acyl dehydratase